MSELTQRGVALGGFMGVGKSTVGAILAEHLGLPFVDTDAVLAERFGPIPAQFERDGEAVFRARERKLIDEICAGPAVVVATGGGVWADGHNRETLAGWGHRVVLHAPLDVLRRRIGEGAGRPLWSEAEALLASRQEAYADAELAVQVGWMPAEDVALGIAEALAPRVVPVASAQGDYPVHVRSTLLGLGRAVAALSGGRSPVLVTDEVVGPLWGEVVAHEIASAGEAPRRITVPDGEAEKHRDTWWSIVDGLLGLGVDRGTPVVALGGGVVGDLAGFAAACTLRGMPVVQVPTTLLSMVDSSVGGKTGFNHPRGKNLVGAFHAPRLVWVATATLRTLDRRQLRSGLGEVVKTALLDDPGLLVLLEERAETIVDDPEALAEVVMRCVQSKARVVGRDEHESGYRAVLNAGHTVGHALEVVAGYGALLHGEAVGLGLVAEIAWAERTGICEDPGLARRVHALLRRLGLPHEPPDLDEAQLVAAMGLDKKARGATLVMPAISSPGQAVLTDLDRNRLSELLS